MGQKIPTKIPSSQSAQSLKSLSYRGTSIKKKSKITPLSKIQEEIICPYCSMALPPSNTTFKDLNEHLAKCKEAVGSTDISDNDFQLAIDYGPEHVDFVNKIEVQSERVEDFSSRSLKQNQKNYKQKVKKIRDEIQMSKSSEIHNLSSIYFINDLNLFDEFRFNSKGKVKVSIKILFNFYINQMVEEKYLKQLENRMLYVSHRIPKDEATLFGSILTKALIDKLNIHMKLSKFLIKQIFGLPIDLEDIKEVEKGLYNELSGIVKRRNFEGLYFVVTKRDKEGKITEDELLLNGKNIQVTQNNINDYIQKRIDYELKKYNGAIIEVAQALFEHIPKKSFQEFSVEELQKMFNDLSKD